MQTQPDKPRPRQHYGVTMAALTAAGVAFSFQNTMVVPALPHLQREFGTTAAWTAWLVTIVLLVSAIATPILGRLGDQFGKERVLVLSFLVFLAGSVAAVFAWDLWSLILCRALQGAGAAVFPLGFAIIRDEFPPRRVGLGMGLVSASFGVGGGIGLVASGVLIDQLSWRWLFAVGAIVIGLSTLAIHLFVPESPARIRSRIDVIGALLLSVALVCLLLGLTEGGNWGWTSAGILAMFGGSVAVFAAWWWVEANAVEPMVDVRMLRRRAILATNLATFIAGFAMFGFFVLIPTFVQMPRGVPADIASRVDYGFGASNTEAGLFLLPGSLILLVGGPLAGLLARRTGSQVTLALGLLVVSLGTATLALWHAERWEVYLAGLVFGTGVSFAFASMPKLISDAVTPRETGVATGLNTTIRMVGAVLGAQVGAVLLSSSTYAGTDVPRVDGFVASFWASAAAGLLGATVALLAAPRRETGRRRVAADVVS